MDDGSPALEVEFAINFHDSLGQLRSLDDIIGRTTADAVREFQRLEAASRGAVDLAGATASIETIGPAASRAARDAAREFARVERSGEAMARTIERQASTFGKTREEIRAMKVETAALAATQQGLFELADRLRGQEASLAAQEKAAADVKRAAATEAVAAAERQAEAMRLAAQAHGAFEAAARRGMAALREQLAAEKALAAESEAQRMREAAAAHALFEAKVREGAKALREQEAAQRAALGAADGYAAKLEAETAAIGKTTAELRAMEVAQRAAAAEAAGLPDQAARIRAAGAAYAEAEARVGALAAEERRLAEATREAAEAARQAAAAQAAQDASVNSLRSAVDPLHASQQRLQRDLENAARLYRAGAIGQEEYERSSRSLAAQLDNVRRAQERQNAGSEDSPNRPKLGGSDVANVVAQLNDIGVSLASGQNPLMVLIQQGSQLQGLMMATGATVGDMARAVAGLLIVTTPTAAATEALAQAELTQAAAQTAATDAGARAAITAAELAVANEAAAAAALADAGAQEALALAQAAVTGATVADAQALVALAAAQTAAAGTAAELTAAEVALGVSETAAAGSSEVAAAAARQLALAQEGAAAAGAQASATAARALAPWLAAIWPVAAALAAAAAAVKLLQNAANDGTDMKAYAASLGLTAKEVRNLDDVTVTFGDTAKAVFQVTGRAIWGAIGPAVSSVWGTMKEWMAWIGSAAKQSVNFLIGGFVGGYHAIKATWSMLPAAMGDLFYGAVNAAISAINSLIRKTVDGVNGFISTANMVLDKVGLHLPSLSAPQIATVNNQFAGAAAKVGKTFSDEVRKATKVDYLGNAASAIMDQARKNARDRIRKQAEDKGYLDPEKPKTDKHAEQIARDAEAVEAQIKNLYALANAYGISGAAALIAEARVKAESDAIKKRGDIEAFVDRQVRLAIAQRVSDAAKSTAALRDQAVAQEQVNAMVVAGTVPAERAAELVKNRIADLPLLAAIEAAQQRGLATEAARATKELDAQRAVRERLAHDERQAQFLTATAAGDDRLAELREELRLIGATDAARAHALAVLKATQEATKFNPENRAAFIDQQVQIADAEVQRQLRADAFNESLRHQADLLDAIAESIGRAGQAMGEAFGSAGRAFGDLAARFTGHLADQERLKEAREAQLTIARQNTDATQREAQIQRINGLYAVRSATAQVELYGDLAASARGFFKEHSAGYRAMATAEKAFRAVQLALAIKSMLEQIGLIGVHVAAKVTGDAAMAASDTARAGVEQGNSIATTAVKAVEAVVNAIKSLPFPLNLAAGAATAAAIAALGVSIVGGFGGGGKPAPTNTGTGTVLGDPTAKSESIKNAIDALKEVDTLMLTSSRQMAISLRSIDHQIGGLASVLVRSGNIDANSSVAQGFKPNAIGSVLSKIPLIGGILGGLFGTKTTVKASGLYAGGQSIGDIIGGGFDAQTYSDVEKVKKFLGITTSKKTSTVYGGAVDANVSDQFALILKSFNDAIIAAAGPLGASTTDIASKVSGFVFTLGKVDLSGLSGTEIQEKLTAVFGAAADQMASSAFPGIERFQKVGEGAFETLVRVSSTVEQVTASLDELGATSRTLGIDAKVGLAEQFDSIGDLTSAVDGYFQAFYTKEEQAVAKAAQFGRVFDSLGLAMPKTLAGFRQLVEAQDLTTAAGQSVYATLLQLAPAFADLKSSMDGAKSAADIASERQDLQRQLLELQGDTAAIRALDLAKLDSSNRALQEQVWAVQDAQEAAKAADELRQAWTSVGDSIMDEVKRIRGLTDVGGGNSFAQLQGQFNAATAAARGGDQDAAKSLPGLSQALLKVAEDTATSRQELARVQAQTAASLEATYGVVSALTTPRATSTASTLADAATAAQATSAPAANDDMAAEIRTLREEIAAMRSENNAGHAATASNAGRAARTLENVTSASGGDAVSVAA